MKKVLCTVLVLLLAFSFVACGSKGKADGVYTATISEAMTAENHGWRDEIVVTYKDGKIVEAKYDAYDADGNQKSKSTAESYPMDPHPTTWIPQMNQKMVEAGSAAKLDAIAGATNSSTNVKLLLAAIEKDGKPGETIVVE